MSKEEKKAKKEFAIPDPTLQLSAIIKQQSKYKIGEVGYSFYHIKTLKPVFAFDYLSLIGSNICFNFSDLTPKDYIGFLEGLKKISSISYDELTRNKAYRFHKVDLDDEGVSLTKKDLKGVLTHRESSLKDEQLPTLYQFDLHYVQKARACGFLFNGVFYIVWYDRDHKIYPKKN